MPFLLDTNIVSDLLKRPRGAAATRLREVGDDKVFTSIVVAAELRYGAERRGSARLTALVEGALARLRVEELSEPADRRYAALRTELERHGEPIGANDLLIAAHALATESVLVTANTREFSRVPGLETENWADG